MERAHAEGDDGAGVQGGERALKLRELKSAS
jgi:hypothetical protein